jgi:hypothetical protein
MTLARANKEKNNNMLFLMKFFCRKRGGELWHICHNLNVKNCKTDISDAAGLRFERLRPTT